MQSFTYGRVVSVACVYTSIAYVFIFDFHDCLLYVLITSFFFWVFSLFKFLFFYKVLSMPPKRACEWNAHALVLQHFQKVNNNSYFKQTTT